jgi:hypothetical protein
MYDDPFHPETRNLLDRADRAIEESIRLRALNAEVRKELRRARHELERQLAQATLKM